MFIEVCSSCTLIPVKEQRIRCYSLLIRHFSASDKPSEKVCSSVQRVPLVTVRTCILSKPFPTHLSLETVQLLREVSSRIKNAGGNKEILDEFPMNGKKNEEKRREEKRREAHDRLT